MFFIDLTTLSTINISSIYIIIMIPIKMIIIKIMIPIKMIMIDAQLHLKASHCAAPPPHRQDLLRSKTAQKVLGDRQENKDNNLYIIGRFCVSVTKK